MTHKVSMNGGNFTPRTANLIPLGIPGEPQATFQKTELEPSDVLW